MIANTAQNNQSAAPERLITPDRRPDPPRTGKRRRRMRSDLPAAGRKLPAREARIRSISVAHCLPGRCEYSRSCRIEDVAPTHNYALDGMFTRDSGNAAVFPQRLPRCNSASRGKPAEYFMELMIGRWSVDRYKPSCSGRPGNRRAMIAGGSVSQIGKLHWLAGCSARQERRPVSCSKIANFPRCRRQLVKPYWAVRRIWRRRTDRCWRRVSASTRSARLVRVRDIGDQQRP